MVQVLYGFGRYETEALFHQKIQISDEQLSSDTPISASDSYFQGYSSSVNGTMILNKIHHKPGKPLSKLTQSDIKSQE